METVPVVTCFCRRDGRILLCRRSSAVGSYPGLWGGVSGHVAADGVDPTAPEQSPAAAARAELREETGIEDATLVRRGNPLSVSDEDRGTRWIVTPFLFDVDGAVETNAETAATEWVHAPAIRERETVPRLRDAYDRVRPRLATVRDDATHGAATLSVRTLEVLRDEAALAAAGADPTDADRTGNASGNLASLARALRDARPAMAVVANRVNRAMAAADATPAGIARAAREGIDRAVRVDREAAATAAAALPDRVATLSRSGTVREALERAAPTALLVAESRPGGEGVGVASDLATGLADTTVTLTTDAALAEEIAERDVDALLVGADRVLPNGDVVNKVGTRSAALAAAATDCEVLVAAATDKVATDAAVDRDERDAEELYDGDAPVAVANPTFDVTPASAIDGYCTERGRLSATDVEAVAADHRRRASW